MVNPVNGNTPSNPSETPSKYKAVPDHVANKMHAQRQAYLNTANDGSNSPSLFRSALTAIGRPLLIALRSARTVGTYTVARVRGGRSEKVVPVNSAPHSLSQSPIRSAIQSAMHSASQSPLRSPLRSPFRSPAVSPRSDSVSDISSQTRSPTPRDGMATTPVSSGRPPLFQMVRSYRGFQSTRAVRSPGEHKSDTPPDSPMASDKARPVLTLDESALHVPSFTTDTLPFRAAVGAMAQGLHQSSRSSSVSSLTTFSTVSSTPSTPFRLLEEYVSPSSSEDSFGFFNQTDFDQIDGAGSENMADDPWIYRMPFTGGFNSPAGSVSSISSNGSSGSSGSSDSNSSNSSNSSISNSQESSEDQSSVGSPPSERARLQIAGQAWQQSSPPGTPPPGHSRLQQAAPQAWWENPDLVQAPEDMDTGCYCGLDLFVSRLVWGDTPNPPTAHQTE